MGFEVLKEGGKIGLGVLLQTVPHRMVHSGRAVLVAQRHLETLNERIRNTINQVVSIIHCTSYLTVGFI